MVKSPKPGISKKSLILSPFGEKPFGTCISDTVIITSSVLDGHAPFEIVHKKIFCPPVKLAVYVPGSLMFVNSPLPERILHVPIPVIGVLAFNVTKFKLVETSNPAFAMVGMSSTQISTSSIVGGQVAPEIVQRKMLEPMLKPVTDVTGDAGLTIVPLPLMSVQNPVPTIGTFPFSVDEKAQIAESIPALATVGKASTKIVTVSVVEGQVPLDIVQTNVLMPLLMPVMPQIGDDGDVNVPVPTIAVQRPVPMAGVFPFKVEVAAQMVESKPALAAEGNGSI